jgi:hypothetical protein
MVCAVEVRVVWLGEQNLALDVFNERTKAPNERLPSISGSARDTTARPH